MNPKNYFELKISFPALEDQLPTKSAILRLLQDRELPHVDEIVDGLEIGVEAILMDEDIRVLPIAVYFPSKDEASEFQLELLKKYSNQLKFITTEIEGEAWSSAWRDEFEYIATDNFLILPENSNHSSSDKIPIYIQEGAAFGNGQHATTEACIRAIENLEVGKHDTVLDVGTGTGILAIALYKLGSADIVGTEISKDLVDEAAKNINHNNCVVKLIECDHLKDFATSHFSLIIANILVPVLIELMDDMVRVLKPGGTIILAGFIEKEAELLRRELTKRNLTSINEQDVRGWKALTYRKLTSH